MKATSSNGVVIFEHNHACASLELTRDVGFGLAVGRGIFGDGPGPATQHDVAKKASLLRLRQTQMNSSRHQLPEISSRNPRRPNSPMAATGSGLRLAAYHGRLSMRQFQRPGSALPTSELNGR